MVRYSLGRKIEIILKEIAVIRNWLSMILEFLNVKLNSFFGHCNCFLDIFSISNTTR